MCPEAVKDEVAALLRRGVPLAITKANNQCYVLASIAGAPVPPWNRDSYELLIAVPAAYDAAALDGFYLELPYTFKNGTHPRVQGTIITVNNRRWQLVSWHYPDGKPWKRGQDDLASHLTHCRGFFLNRGAVNAY